MLKNGLRAKKGGEMIEFIKIYKTQKDEDKSRPLNRMVYDRQRI